MSRYNILLQPESPSADKQPSEPAGQHTQRDPNSRLAATQASGGQALGVPSDGGSDQIERSTHSPVDHRAGPVSNPTTERSTGQSTNRLTELSSNQIVGRPKAFYITERLDRWLDRAVDYYQTIHGIKCMDRSTIVNALLDDESLWNDDALDQLVERIISQLTSRLTG